MDSFEHRKTFETIQKNIFFSLDEFQSNKTIAANPILVQVSHRKRIPENNSDSQTQLVNCCTGNLFAKLDDTSSVFTISNFKCTYFERDVVIYFIC